MPTTRNKRMLASDSSATTASRGCPVVISQAQAKRIYCLTQKDIQKIKALTQALQQRRGDCATQRPQAASAASASSTECSMLLNEEIVMNYALHKHGGTQQGIDLAIMERHAARLQRAAIIKCNILERKARAARVSCVCLCVCACVCV